MLHHVQQAMHCSVSVLPPEERVWQPPLARL